jgi:hypothetical protein
MTSAPLSLTSSTNYYLVLTGGGSVKQRVLADFHVRDGTV